jgi:CheY-like chemotaxis protein
LDLMIADVFTPSMRGFEAIRLFHERAPTMPLVAISGYAFADMEISAPEFLRLATRPGATRCLRKPFKPATSPGVIDECQSEAESHRRHVTALAAVAAAQARSKSPDATADASLEVRRFGGGRPDAFSRPKLRRSSAAAKSNAVRGVIREGDQRAARLGF